MQASIVNSKQENPTSMKIHAVARHESATPSKKMWTAQKWMNMWKSLTVKQEPV